MNTLALIDYGSGNLHSAERALRLVADQASRALDIVVTSDPDQVAESERIVLPGVGHFADCAKNLKAQDGLIEALEEAVIETGRPFFGICVGQQLLATRGLEDGDTPGLDWIPGTVAQIEPGAGYRIPHVGWNGLTLIQDHPVMADLGEDPHVYFTHSFAYRETAEGNIAAKTDYGGDMIAAVARDNLFATQFHPEKSQRVGLKILSNFVTWDP